MYVGDALVRWWSRSPWRDAAVAAGYLAFGGAFHAAGLYPVFSGSDVTSPLWQRLVVLAVGCAGLLLRTRSPLLGLAIGLLAVAADAWMGISVPMLLVLADLLYAATLRSSSRVSRAVVIGVVVMTLAVPVGSGSLVQDWRAVVVLTMQAFALLIIPVWWAREVRQHRDIAEAERLRHEQLLRAAELDRRAAIDAERARMARDLHDIVAGHLSAIAIQSEAVLSMDGGDPETVRTVLRSVRENSLASLTEMRAMIDVLRAGETGHENDPHAAPARLRDLGTLVESARAGGVRVTLTADFTSAPGPARDRTGTHGVNGGTEPELPAAVDLTAYRIVQEALTNTVKHAPGSRAWVALNRDGGRLTVEVTNELPEALENGPSAGREPPAGGVGAGLMSMRERARAVGGTLSAGRCADGWRVYAVLPLEGAALSLEGRGT